MEGEQQAVLATAAEPLVRGHHVRIVAAAAVLLTAGGGAYTPALQHAQTPGVRPSIAPTEVDGAQPGTTDEQAQAVDDVLFAAIGLTPMWTVDLGSCESVVGAMEDFEAYVQARQSQLARTRNLRVDWLEGGSELRRAMLDAYQYSLNASQAYLAWSHEVEAENCGESTPPVTGNLRRAQAADAQAESAKQQVVSLWDPIASSQGLTAYVPDDI